MPTTKGSVALRSNLSVEEAYHSVEEYIWKLVNEYFRAFGGERDELFAQAQLLFMQAWQTWNPKVSKLITHVHYQVYWGLRSSAKKRARQGGEHIDEAALGSLVARQSFDLDGLLSELSQEAREVAQVALGLGDGGKVRLSQVAELLAEAGWAAAEVLRVFKEIREALS